MPQTRMDIVSKGQFSLLLRRFFDEMKASFLIHRFGSVGRDVITSDLAECNI